MFSSKKKFLFVSILLSFFALLFLLQYGYISLAFENPPSPPPFGGGYLQTQSNQLLITKPIMVRSGNDLNIASGSLLNVSGTSKFYSRIQVLGNASPTSGVGLELGYDVASSAGIITAVDRDAGFSSFKDLKLNANKITFENNLNPVLIIANNTLVVGTSTSNYPLEIFRNNTSSVLALSVNSSSNSLYPKIVFRSGNPLQELFHLGVVYNSPTNYELKIATLSNLTTSESIAISPQLDLKLGAGNLIMNKGDLIMNNSVAQSIIKNSGNLNINASNDIIFFTSSTQQRMIIKQNGNIGINNPNPSALLDVAGKGKFSELEVTGTMTIPALFKYGSTSSGYYYCIQDFIIQWGEVEIPATPKVANINLPKAYIDNSYNVQVSFKSKVGTNRSSDPGVFQIDKQQFQIINNFGFYSTFTWLTVGRGNCN